MRLFLFLIVFSLNTLAKDTLADLENDFNYKFKMKMCYQEKNGEACGSLGAIYRALDLYDKAYAVDKYGCELNDRQTCEQLFYVAQESQPPEVFKATLKMLEEKCEKNDEFCGSISAYYEKKDVKKYLVLAKRYYEKTKQGAYPYDEYKKGNKAEGIKLINELCLGDKANNYFNCSFYISNVPEHPNIKKFVALREDVCLGSGNNSGACEDMAEYYLKQNNKVRSLAFTVHACSMRNDSCLGLLRKPEELDRNTLLQAFQNFCKKSEKHMTEFRSSRLRKKYCPLNGVVPTQITPGFLDQVDRWLNKSEGINDPNYPV